MTPLSIAWHRGDLRTHDHAALSAAAADGPAIGLVILDDNILNATSARRRAYFSANVSALRESYRARGGTLYIRSGKPDTVLPAFIRDISAHHPVNAVHALRSYTPYGIARDTSATQAAPMRWHDGLYIHAPGDIRTKTNGAFSVYAPYRNTWRATDFDEPLESPRRIASPPMPDVPPGDVSDVVCDVELPPAGEDAALKALSAFLDKRLNGYASGRDRLDGAQSSRLSPFITIGTLSARTAAAAAWGRSGPGPLKWIDEVIWRDFLADMLYHRPTLTADPFHPRWKDFEWNDSEDDFVAWRDGNTGIPAVDAAMRELRATGWISNRARMIAAQFLTKHLRIHWTKGAAVFHEWLLDGDVASNTGNWQWAAGLGIDNAPYFRVFNPVTQAKQHDPDGTWVAKWVPESFGRPDAMPHAIVNLAEARREYLAAASATAGTQ